MLNRRTKVVWIMFTFEVTSRDISPQHVTLPANFYLFPLRYRDRGRYFITTRSRVRLKILRAKRTSCRLLLVASFAFARRKSSKQKVVTQDVFTISKLSWKKIMIELRRKYFAIKKLYQVVNRANYTSNVNIIIIVHWQRSSHMSFTDILVLSYTYPHW